MMEMTAATPSKRGNADFQRAIEREGVARHFFRHGNGLKRGVRYFLPFFGEAGFFL